MTTVSIPDAWRLEFKRLAQDRTRTISRLLYATRPLNSPPRGDMNRLAPVGYEQYSSFVTELFTYYAFIPMRFVSADESPLPWIIQVFDRLGKKIRSDSLTMTHSRLFTPHPADVELLNLRVEQLMEELGT